MSRCKVSYGVASYQRLDIKLRRFLSGVISISNWYVAYFCLEGTEQLVNVYQCTDRKFDWVDIRSNSAEVEFFRLWLAWIRT